MATPKLTILLSGMIAGVPHQGGATWTVLQYLLGFKRLGHNVLFVEPVKEAALRPAGAPLARSENAAYFQRVMADCGVEQTSALLLAGTNRTVGVSYERLREIARRADSSRFPYAITIRGFATTATFMGRLVRDSPSPGPSALTL